MGSFSATRLDQPPPSSPDVSSQTGASPFSGMSQMIAEKLGSKPGGDKEAPISETHPQGAILAMFEAVKKAAEQMARINDEMKPFVDRALGILEQGVKQAVAKGGKPGAGAETPEPTPGGGKEMPSGSAKPSVGSMSSFPG